MATANLKWISSRSKASTRGWKNLRAELGEEFVTQACDSRTVYVIRILRPFVIHYPENVSPVTYIGRGNFRQRIVSHLQWINPLSRKIPDLMFEVLVSQPRAQKNLDFYKDVEADLLLAFQDRFGAIPVRNARRESHSRTHTYSKKDLARALSMGQGPGYHWAIWPVGSNPLRIG